MPDSSAPSTSDSRVSRRSLLGRSAASGFGVALIGSVEGLFGASASADPGTGRGTPGPAGYGPLLPDPAGILSLPAGFTYTIAAQSGVTRLESGQFTPSDPDGMAAFVRRGGNGSVLVNNHEIGGSEPDGVPAIPGFVYDPLARGGTTTIEVDKDGPLAVLRG